MAEYIFKNKTSDIYCESAATSNEEIGNDIYPPAKRCLDNHHIPYNRHYARRVTPKDYETFDKIYVMDSYNMSNILRILEDPQKKIEKLCPYDIEDPWYTDNFEKVYEEIQEGIDRILNGNLW